MGTRVEPHGIEVWEAQVTMMRKEPTEGLRAMLRTMAVLLIDKLTLADSWSCDCVILITLESIRDRLDNSKGEWVGEGNRQRQVLAIRREPRVRLKRVFELPTPTPAVASASTF